jgi:hypothetical protein
MHRWLLVFLCVLASVGLLPAPSRGDTTASGATPPPQIYHIVTTALCARIHDHVRPAVAMVLENDQRIAKSVPLFNRYNRQILENGSDSINVSSASQDMTIQQMSYLVIPTARNLIAAQTLMDDPKLTAPTGNAADDATLVAIRKQLLQTIAFQSASLDLINGFVQTQQLGEIQHAGEEYLAEIQGGEVQKVEAAAGPATQYQDPTNPGISQNPYALDVSMIPGLAIGYNPISHIIDGMQWLHVETAKREDGAGKTISAAMTQCPK